ncbi:hypothetical protein BSZ40_02975 [Buchananella hordeovulneris]|uniref:ABC transporter n=1 Tax=Buchananella hordeovulneris TaxID=52770 RepID=A0A1Q5PY75_9ACTO|nr:hypothetical protein BSZ40_02975 [Buchananella hordeovulneris]
MVPARWRLVADSKRGGKVTKEPEETDVPAASGAEPSAPAAPEVEPSQAETADEAAPEASEQAPPADASAAVEPSPAEDTHTPVGQAAAPQPTPVEASSDEELVEAEEPPADPQQGETKELERLAEAISALAFPLPLPDVTEARTAQDQTTGQLRNYIIPRFARLDAPLLAVVGGSTGAGKSTIVNSLAGRVVSLSSVIRPTTRRPVLLHAPGDGQWFADDRILGDLRRVHGEDSDVGTGTTSELRLREVDSLPAGLAILDAPDIDSVVTENRELAGHLLAAADLWVFVTTAARYADAIPWDLLHAAAERNVVVAVVLNRIPVGTTELVRDDLAARLVEAGLGGAPLFVIPETTLDDDGLLSTSDVAGLREWLDGLVSDANLRGGVARQTLRGAIMQLQDVTTRLAASGQLQVEAISTARTEVERAFAGAHAELGQALNDGALLRGEVLSRWHEFVGTGEFFRQAEGFLSRTRDKLTSLFRAKPQPQQAEEALEDSLQLALVAAAERATEQALAAWRRQPGLQELGKQVAKEVPTAEMRLALATTEVRGWQRGIVERIRSEAGDKRAAARVLSLGINAVGVALMVVVFASTGGLVGGELAVAGGTAVVAQKVLESIFGDQAVRKMAKDAHADLVARADRFFGIQQSPFLARLDDLDDPAPALGELSAARAGIFGEETS